MKIEKFCWER